ncbi:S-layer homology domain-containing protein [Indiicoccus explosivorum]|uniref:S-layer homology domain-containing protein n=1 Tax=Indiicoccus explosivorum TaxID=1917864 RepID=UPI000B44B366|nr:S-layer homology domain-containing protein [Indiicoccus explosivorum]
MAYQAKSYKKFVATAATATLVASAIAPVASADEVSTAAFTDVPDRYEPAIEYVVEEGIAKGLTATQFGISESIKRGDAAIMLATAADLIDPDAPVAPFTDVPTRGQLAVGSLWAENVVNGYDEDTFGFSANITRGEAAYMLAEAYNLYDFVNIDEVDLNFTDVPSRFEAAVKALVAFEITQGVTPTQFGADDYIKRGDFAVFLYRLNQAFSDTVAPELSFDFDVDTAIEVGVGEEFVLPEVTAIDDIDGEITVVPVITNEAGEEVDAVDTSAPGTYYITYTAIDAAGNVSEVVVEVVVVADSALTLATEAVVVAETSLLEEDVAAAQELVDALEDSDEKTLLNVRLDEVREEIDAIIADVNAAVGELQLFNALNVVPFENVNEDYIAEYVTAIQDVDFTSLADIQAAIDAVNLAQLEAEIAVELAEARTAIDNVLAVDVTSPDFDLAAFNELVVAAEAAIADIPADYIPEGAEEALVVTLQAELDEEVEFVENYVNLVEPVVTAGTQVELYNALVAGFDNVVEANIGAYDTELDAFVGLDTVEEVQFVIDSVNAEATVSAFVVDAETTQAELVALVELVEGIPNIAVDAEGNPVATQVEVDLLAAVDALQLQFETLAEATVALEEATEAAEAAQAVYAAAGGDVEAAVYTNVTAELEALADVDLDSAAAITAATDALLTDVDALTTATEALVALDVAIAEANAAQAAYLAAGGVEGDQLYVDVTTAIESGDVATIDTAVAALEAATAELELIADVNTATTGSELILPLVNLELETYNNLTAVQRAEVADLFLEAFADTEFAGITEIETALSDLVVDYGALFTALDTAIATGEITDVDVALEALNLEEYEALTAAEQLVAAELVLNNEPEGGYTSFAQITAQF